MPSSESDLQSHSDRVTPLGIVAGIGLIPHFLWLSAAMCGAFAAIAGIAITGYLVLTDFEPEAGLYARMGIKILILTAITVAAGYATIRRARIFPPRLHNLPLRPSGPVPRVSILLLVVLFGLLVHRVSDYPWTAPDELHHLIVARNLADHNEYASGHPDGELLRFDPYDSVGPSVIVPVATAMQASPDNLVAARATMAVLFVSWVALVYAFFRPVFGERAAAISAGLAATSFASIYLGRSLYGEVPALMYLTAGLLIWRRAIEPNASPVWNVVAGCCFAFAVLAKTFMVLCAFPMAATFSFDRLTLRRIRWRDVLIPFGAVVLIVGAWLIYSGSRSTADNAQDSFVHLYRHYLMFGFDGVPHALLWIAGDWTRWLALAGIVVGGIAILPLIAIVRYDPPTIALTLVGILFGFWWLFFTPGTIPRYLWYSLAIGAALCGPIIVAALQALRDRQAAPAHRMAAALVLLAVLAPAVDASVFEIRRIVSADELVDERALTAYVRDQSSETLPPTTSWMARRSANFFADTWLELVDPNTTEICVRDTYLEEFSRENTQPLPGSDRYRLETWTIESNMTP